MAVTLTYTPGGASDNSYVTLAEAEAHFANRLNSSVNGDWTNDAAGVARTDDVKKAALITATLRIDEEMFLGYKVTTTQALKWPRYNVYDEDGIVFDSTTIPALRRIHGTGLVRFETFGAASLHPASKFRR